MAVGGGALVARPREAAGEAVVLYKSPTCICCGRWAAHLRESGFDVVTVEEPNPAATRERQGVPDALGSFHTAKVGGYVVEGHVPADAVRRLLRERPAVSGLAVPRMPAGTPGMEGPHREAYDVLAFRRGGPATVFSRH